MRFDRNFYAESWRVLCILWPYVLLAVFGEFASGATLASSKAHIGESADLIHNLVVLLIWGFLLYRAHIEVLLPDRGDRRTALKPVLWFTVLLFLIYALVLASLTAITSLFVSAAEVVFRGFGWAEPSGPILVDFSDMKVLVGVGLLFLSLAFGGVLTFVLFGTTLPSFVATNRSGFRRAFGRGWRQLSWLSGRLMVGAVFVFVCAGVLRKFAPGAPALWEDWTAAYDLSKPSLTAMILTSSLCSVYADVMVAVLLSRAYLRDEAAQGEPAREEETPTTQAVS